MAERVGFTAALILKDGQYRLGYFPIANVKFNSSNG